MRERAIYVKFGNIAMLRKKIAIQTKNKPITFYTSSHEEVEFVYSALEPGLSSDLLGMREYMGGTLCDS